ncbi:MAG: sulfite exporter TauE/SafE family protein [Bacteroidales bacterium]|nr:sulfite exporter TauE/SafE family protein [Bacteroidales bacterium]
MDFLQSLLNSSTTPILTAFILGLLTALSPCPLATNIASVAYIVRDVEKKRTMFINGLLYVLGRTLSYTLLGIVLILILKSGTSLFGVQRFIATYGEKILGPALLLIGLFMLFGKNLNLPSFCVSNKNTNLSCKGGFGALLLGILFALAFCPTSCVFYFGMLIPISATIAMGYFLPIVFAIATGLPVLFVAWILAFSTNKIGEVYGKMQLMQKWLNIVVGVIFVLIGIYYCITIYI